VDHAPDPHVGCNTVMESGGPGKTVATNGHIADRGVLIDDIRTNNEHCRFASTGASGSARSGDRLLQCRAGMVIAPRFA